MNIYYITHSSFLIKTQNGKRILTDPFEIDESKSDVDIITISHNHFDHCNLCNFSDETKIFQSNVNYENKFCKITTFESFHDNLNGLKRGGNLIFKIEADGFSLCHLGDLGHKLDDYTISKIGDIDVLFVPVGENFTISLDDLKKTIHKISPKFIIPMHYKTKGIAIALNYLDVFLKKFKSLKKIELDTLSLSSDEITQERNVIAILKAQNKSTEI